MEPDLVVHALARDHFVVELHERLTADLGLDLHLVIGSDGSGTLAWWESDRGGWLAAVVGRA
jgi:hypothetical protein